MIIDLKRSIKWLFHHLCYIHIRWPCYSCWQQFYTPPCLPLFVLFRLRRKTSQPTTNQLERFTLRFRFMFLFCWGCFGFRIILIIPFIDCHSDYYIILMKVMFGKEHRPANHKPVEKQCSGCWKPVYHLESHPPPTPPNSIKFTSVSICHCFPYHDVTSTWGSNISKPYRAEIRSWSLSNN